MIKTEPQDIKTQAPVRKKYDLPNLTTFCLNQSEYFVGLFLKLCPLMVIIYGLPPPEKDSMIQSKPNVGVTVVFLQNVRLDMIEPLKLNGYI